MPSLFVIGHLKTAGGAARQTVIDALTKTAVYSAAHEPGVLKFCVTIPREGDDKSVIAIEEYADQEAMDRHMVSPPVKDLLEIFGKDPSLFAEPPAIYGLPEKLEPAVSFTRPELGRLEDPYIIFAGFECKRDQSTDTVESWKKLVGFIKGNEERALSYTVLDDQNTSWVRTVEAYDNKESSEQIRMNSEAIREHERQTAEFKTKNKEVLRLKMIAGYLYKEGLKLRL